MSHRVCGDGGWEKKHLMTARHNHFTCLSSKTGRSGNTGEHLPRPACRESGVPAEQRLQEDYMSLHEPA